MAGSVVLVHGTGVRLRDYKSGFETAKSAAAEAGLETEFVECAWGDPIGVIFEGFSLPDPPGDDALRAEAEDNARWEWLFADPFLELERLSLPDPDRGRTPPVFGKPLWEKAWDEVLAYAPGDDMRLLLRRAGIDAQWDFAWASATRSNGIPKSAFMHSAHELHEPAQALARCVVAHLHLAALATDRPGPGRPLRTALVDRLVSDWGYRVLAPSGLLLNLFKRVATGVMRRDRNKYSAIASLPIGDILLYQSRGAEIRDFLRSKVKAAKPPVTLVAHSLGGIAAFELLATGDAPDVHALVTVGSQAPLLYEIGALTALSYPGQLPASFPRWLNVYDRADFLSFVGGRLFPGKVDDHQVDSGQPFPDSHGAYFGNVDVWKAVREFAAP